MGSREVFAVVALGTAALFAVEANASTSTVDATRSAPAAVIPEPLKMRLGGFVEKGPAEGKGRRKYRDVPTRGLPKAS